MKGLKWKDTAEVGGTRQLGGGWNGAHRQQCPKDMLDLTQLPWPTERDV